MADYAQNFGPVARKFDMGTQIATAVQQGAQNFRCVRVSDSTDTAAQTILPGTTVTLQHFIRELSATKSLWRYPQARELTRGG